LLKNLGFCDKSSGEGLIAQKLSVSFSGTAALQGVSLEVAAGEAVALVGPSGAGKTTLLRVLATAQEATAGSVKLGGRDYAHLSGVELQKVRACIGMVHQDHALVPNLRVAQNVLSGRLGRHGFFGVLRRVVRPPKAELLEVHALLDRLGIAEKMFHRTDSLSGGMQQRVAIARALFQEPHVLLADEPVASVDPARAVDLLRLLRAVAEERQLPLVVSLHDVQLARACFPRVVGMRAGAVVFDAPTADVDTAAFEELYAL